MLSAMGIESDKIDEIIEAHIETVNGLKEDIDKYKTDAGRYEAAEKELATLKANGEKSPYKVKYEALVEERDNLQKEFDDYKNSVAAKETTARKQAAYSALLKEAGVNEKRIAAVMKVSDFETLDFEDGKFKDSEAILDSIKTEWADFIVAEHEQGAKVPNPPAGTTKGKVLTRDEIVKIKDTSERQRAWDEYLKQEREK